MKRVMLTIGPQYVGKSTFCEKVVAAYPHVSMASRDKILIELYGTVWLDAYTCGHLVAWDRLWKEVEEHLKQPDVTLILDAWNGGPKERAGIVSKLRALGADHVEGWHFVTPLKTCIEWSLEKNPIPQKNKWSKIRLDIHISEYSEIHRLFCSWSMEREGVFDSVRRINSLEPIPEDLFGQKIMAATSG